METTANVRYEGKRATFTGWGYHLNNVTDFAPGGAEIQSEVLKKLDFTVTPDQDMSRYGCRYISILDITLHFTHFQTSNL